MSLPSILSWYPQVCHMQRVVTGPVLARSPVLTLLSLFSASTFLSLDLYSALAPISLASAFRNLSVCLPHSTKHSSRLGDISSCVCTLLSKYPCYTSHRESTQGKFVALEWISLCKFSRHLHGGVSGVPRGRPWRTFSQRFQSHPGTMTFVRSQDGSSQNT